MQIIIPVDQFGFSIVDFSQDNQFHTDIYKLLSLKQLTAWDENTICGFAKK